MKRIALVIRGKYSEEHSPDLLNQHADVVLTTGEPMGFFGEGNGASAGSGMFMDGFIYDFNVMSAKRPAYVDAGLAKEGGLVSTICVIEVSDEEGTRFDSFWRSPRPELRTFSLLGDNCSAAASLAFRSAGIVPDGIPGLDTPDNLFRQLKNRYGGRFSCKSGYVGFEKIGNHYQAIVK